MWKNGEYYKLRKRDGRKYIEVCFAWDKTRWISTKETESDKAETFARNYIIRIGNNSILEHNVVTFGEFAEDFFDKDKDPAGYIKHRNNFGKDLSANTLHSYSYYLRCYILPKFKNRDIKTISAIEIEDWYCSLKGVNSKKLLSSNTRSSILLCMTAILNEAVRLKLIPTNPCTNVTRLKIRAKEKKIFSEQELSIMFPTPYEELLKIWKKPQFALFFSIAIDTGWRCSEILALSNENYIEDLKGVYTEQSYNIISMEIQDSVKTSNSGYRYRVGFLSDRSIECIANLPLFLKNGYWFSSDGKNIIHYSNFRYRLINVLKMLGIDTTNAGIHSFRHTFLSRNKTTISETEALKLMGHTQYRSEYDHSSPEQRILQLASVKDKVVYK